MLVRRGAHKGRQPVGSRSRHLDLQAPVLEALISLVRFHKTDGPENQPVETSEAIEDTKAVIPASVVNLVEDLLICAGPRFEFPAGVGHIVQFGRIAAGNLELSDRLAETLLDTLVVLFDRIQVVRKFPANVSQGDSGVVVKTVIQRFRQARGSAARRHHLPHRMRTESGSGSPMAPKATCRRWPWFSRRRW